MPLGPGEPLLMSCWRRLLGSSSPCARAPAGERLGVRAALQRWASSSRIDAFLDLSPRGEDLAARAPCSPWRSSRLAVCMEAPRAWLSASPPPAALLRNVDYRCPSGPVFASCRPLSPSPLRAFCCSHYREAPVSVCHDVPLGPGGPLRVACWWWLHGLSAFCPLLSGAREVVLCMHINLETSVFLMALVQRKLGIPRILRFLPLNCFAYVLLFRRFWGSHLGCVPYPNAAPCASGPRRIWYLVRAQNGWGRRACCH